MANTVTLTSKDGEHTTTLPASEKGEINRFRALGWSEPEPDAPAGDYDAQTAAQLQEEIDRRTAAGATITVGGKGNKPDLIAALVANDQDGADA